MQHWSQGLQTSFFASGKKLTFLDESHGAPIYNKSVSLYSFGGSVKIVTSSRLNFISDLEIAQTLFYEGHPSDNGFEINTPPILRIHPGLDYRFLKVEGLELRGETGVSFYAPGSYDQYNVNLGYGYDLGLKVSHTLESQNIIHCKLFYGARKQDTSILNFTELLTGMQCGLSFGGIR